MTAESLVAIRLHIKYRGSIYPRTSWTRAGITVGKPQEKGNQK